MYMLKTEKKLIKYIESGEFYIAEKIIDDRTALESDNSDLLEGKRYLKFWKEIKEKIDALNSYTEIAGYLENAWKHFFFQLIHSKNFCEEFFLPVKHWVFTNLLHLYKELVQDLHQKNMIYKLSIAYKGIGAYDDAYKWLSYLVSEEPENAKYIAQYADCYNSFNKLKSAKLYFREAFFLGPEKVDLHFIESQSISRIIERIVNFGYSDNTITYWIPVFGYLFDFLNIKRELSAVEYGKLLQSIQNLENEMDQDQINREIFEPILLNSYLVLLDYLYMKQLSFEKISEAENKLFQLNADIYAIYEKKKLNI